MKDYKARAGQKGRKPTRNAAASKSGGKGHRSHQNKPFPNQNNDLGKSVSRSWIAGWVKLMPLPALPGFRLGSLPFMLWMLCALWLAGGAVMGGLALWDAPLETVRLEGNRNLKGQALLDSAGLSAGMRMHQVDPFEVARKISAHPQVATADARRIFPGVLSLHIRVRVPQLALRLTDGRTAILDQDNVVLSVGGGKPGEKRLSLPLVEGVSGYVGIGSPILHPALTRARRTLEVLQRLGFSELERVEIQAGKPFRSEILLPGGQSVLLPDSGVEDALLLYRTLVGVHPDLLKGMAVVDLSITEPGGRIVMSPRASH